MRGLEAATNQLLSIVISVILFMRFVLTPPPELNVAVAVAIGLQLARQFLLAITFGFRLHAQQTIDGALAKVIKKF
jgi:hypothetical protein